MVGKFDSEAFYERLYLFGLNCAKFTTEVPKSGLYIEYKEQLIRSSGSVGSNYIEALEAMSKKDFIHKLKISRKESRESVHWLRLIKDLSEVGVIIKQAEELIQEGNEIKRVLSSSILTLETQ